jgi:hypothetical protein
VHWIFNRNQQTANFKLYLLFPLILALFSDIISRVDQALGLRPLFSGDQHPVISEQSLAGDL